MNRRTLLMGSSLLVLRPWRALAGKSNPDIVLTELVMGAGGGTRGNALARLAWELDKRTAVSVNEKPAMVRLQDQKIAESPLLILAGDKGFAIPSNKEIERLRQCLQFGGTLWIDSSGAPNDTAFDESVKTLLSITFPGQSLAPVLPTHVIGRSFYLTRGFQGRVVKSPGLFALERDKRCVVLYSRLDVLGAMMRNEFGQPTYPCEPGGEMQREQAIRLAVNLLMYVLCQDYKDDQVHVEEVMRRRQLPQGGGTP